MYAINLIPIVLISFFKYEKKFNWEIRDWVGELKRASVSDRSN